MKKILKVIVANIAAFLHIPLLIVSIPFKVIAIAHSIIIDLSTQFMAVLCVAFMLTGIIGASSDTAFFENHRSTICFRGHRIATCLYRTPMGSRV